jgi:hypothetical protein
MLHQGIMSVSQESNIVRKQISPLQLYHGENKLIFNEMMMMRFVLDQHT